MKKALTGFVAIAAVALIWLASTRDNDSRTPGTDPSGVAEAGGPLAEVTIPDTLTADAQNGKVYYEAVCSTCHGANGAGQDGVAPPLVHVIYEPSHHGDAAFVLAARNGVNSHHWRFGNMPPIEERLTDGEIGAIVAYIRELQRANGIN